MNALKQYIYSLMVDKRKGPRHFLLKLVLAFISIFYYLLISLRRLFYDLGLFKVYVVPCKVISVGNLTLGGTGKTPFSIMLVRLINARMKRKACILIRGYGWDEQGMLKEELADVPVLVGRDRVANAVKAKESYGQEAIVLDDGFQHRRLHRDLDVVLVDMRNPFGNKRLLPRGILREPIGSIERASICVLTKVNKSLFNREAIKGRLKGVNGRLLFLEAIHRPTHLAGVDSSRSLGLDFIKGKRVLLVSSIGDPGYFEETVKDLEAQVTNHLIYPDHYQYHISDFDRIAGDFDREKASFLVTTQKDMIKLRRLPVAERGLPILTLYIEMKIVSGEEEFIARLHSVFSG